MLPVQWHLTQCLQVSLDWSVGASGPWRVTAAYNWQQKSLVAKTGILISIMQQDTMTRLVRSGQAVDTPLRAFLGTLPLFHFVINHLFWSNWWQGAPKGVRWHNKPQKCACICPSACVCMCHLSLPFRAGSVCFSYLATPLRKLQQ